MLQTGSPAPDLSLPSADLQMVSLSSLWAKGPLVVLFFPAAFTSTCTAEMCAVRDDWSAYQALDATVAAVSVDSPWVLDRYRAELSAPALFLSDFNREAARAFGVERATALGPGLMGVADRAAFVVGTDGVVRYAWHSANPGLLPPFDEIKAALGERASAAA